MIGQIHHVWTWDDSQCFGKVVAVGEVQVEDIADFWMLWKDKSTIEIWLVLILFI